MSKAKQWCFTLNNYKELLDPSLFPSCTFCVYQEEVGESGTPHLQGFLQFCDRVSLPFVRDLPGLDGAHFEIVRGSAKQNVAYVTKADGRLGGPYEFGEIGKAK